VRFYWDEGVDRQIVERLRAEGFETHYVAEIAPSISDERVLQEANALGALLVTMDKDFGELVFRLGKLTTGVFLVRLHEFTAAQRADMVAAAVLEHGSELAGAFTVLSPTRLRIRPRSSD
jgi:predicted nuclease of predicted toxin-antitoxin system